MRFPALFFTAICLIPLLSHSVMGQGISLSPTRLFFTGNPGETVSQTITFSNTSKKPFSFNTRIQDFERDSLGNKVYLNRQTLSASNAGWISISSNGIVIQPGEKQEVILTLNIPKDARTQTSSMIFFTQSTEQQPQNIAGTSLGINVLLEMGIQIYYTPKGLSSGELEFISFEDRGNYDNGNNKSRRLALKIHNTGAINKDGFVRFELTNKETGEEIKVKAETIAMLPNATQWVLLDLPADLKGKYLVVAILDAGASYDLKVAEKEIKYSH